MNATNGSHPIPRNRNISSISEQTRRDSLLRSAWVNIVAGFHCRPDPRGAWDEPARGRTTPWNPVVGPIRGALKQAVESGDRALMEQTLEGARAFLRELEADFASLIPQAAEESLLTLALEETRAEGAANSIQMELASAPNCPTAAERAVLPLERHYSRIAKLLERCRITARSPRTSSMVLSR